MLPESLKGILGACRSETAAWLLEWRKADLIESDQDHEREDGNLAYDFPASVIRL